VLGFYENPWRSPKAEFSIHSNKLAGSFEQKDSIPIPAWRGFHCNATSNGEFKFKVKLLLVYSA
jgi:hypothetical protein